MKKVFIWILIIAILLPGVFADTSKTIYDGWIFYNDEVIHGEDIYKIMSSDVHLDDKEKGKILIRKDDLRYVVYFDDCIEDTLFRFCFVNRSFSREEVDIDSKGILQPAIQIKFTKLGVELKKTKTFSKTKEFIVGDKTEVVITFNNTGDIDITNFTVHEIVPENFEIIKSNYKSPFKGNEFTTTFNLFSGSNWQTKYTLKALSAQETSYETNITYDTEEEKGIIEHFGKQELKFEESHTFVLEELEKEYHRGKKDTFSFVITNEEEVDLKITRLKIEVPTPISVTSKQNLKETSRQIFTSDELIIKRGDSKKYGTTVRFPNIGNQTIEYEVNFDIRDKSYSYQGEYNISVILPGIDCYIELSENITAATNMEYEVFVENIAKETFYEITGNYSIFDKRGMYSFANIGKEGKEQIGQGEVLVPFDLETKNYTLEVNTAYRTVDEQYYTCETEQEITAIPAKQLLKLETYFENKTSNRNKTTILIVNLENMLDIDLTDEIEIYFSSKRGRAEKIVLNGLTKTQEVRIDFFIYELVKHESVNVTVHINIPTLNEYADSKIATINISNPYTGNLSIEHIEETIFKELKERDNERQNLNFVEKIILYFKNFFK